MSNHTIAPQITTWAEARYADREVLNRAEVASLLALDPRTIDHAIADGTIPAVHVGRRILIPRRPLLAAFGALFDTSAPDEAPSERKPEPTERSCPRHRFGHPVRHQGRPALAISAADPGRPRPT